jgi:hypothetical protein
LKDGLKCRRACGDSARSDLLTKKRVFRTQDDRDIVERPQAIGTFERSERHRVSPDGGTGFTVWWEEKRSRLAVADDGDTRTPDNPFGG